MESGWLLVQEGLSLPPALTPGAPGQSSSSAHCLQLLWAVAQRKPVLAAGRRRCGAWGASLRAWKGASGEQEGGLQCLGAKFSSALFWVTTFTMFFHSESFRLPARLRCFQLMGSHTYLTTGLVQGLPSSLPAALSLLTAQQGAQVPEVARLLSLVPPWLIGREAERVAQKLGAKWVVMGNVRVQAQRYAGYWLVFLCFTYSERLSYWGRKCLIMIFCVSNSLCWRTSQHKI